MDIGRARDPGHQGGVLDGIPGPIATPAEYFVGPASTEHHAGRKKAPGEECPAPRRAKPGRAEFARHERREGERKGQSEAGKARVEHDRMDQHDGMLEEWIQPVAIRESLIVGHRIERQRLEIRQQQKEGDVHEHPDAHPGHQRAILVAVAEHGGGTVGGQHPAPEQQRSRLSAPERAESIMERHRARGMRSDITQCEVVRRERPEQCEHCDRCRREDQQERALGDSSPLGATPDARIEARTDPDQRE